MKILRSIHSLNPAIGGPMEAVKQSSAVLIGRGHRVEIVCLDSPDDPWIRQYPVTVHALGSGRGGYGYTPRFTRWIRDRHREYDAVIVHGLWRYNSFGVWRALSRTGTPYFVFPHGMLDPWFNRTYPLKHIKKLLYWPWTEYRVLRDAAAVLFTSEEERRLARESFRPYRCNEVIVNYGTAPPDVDLATAGEDFFDKFPPLRGKRFLLYLGRLHEKKGCDLLINAFAHLWRARAPSRSVSSVPAGNRVTGHDSAVERLLIAGPASDQDYLERLKQLAADSAAPITFAGMLSGDLKWGAFSAADAFVLPSHQENFGIAVVESLACGTPVLISNKVNIWREIVNDGAGFADEDHLAGVTRLLKHWMNLPAAERDAMRTNARVCFERRFEINRAVDSLLQVLEEHIAG
jgi:glycosyltransferase involved in cell wall biosynthesis